MSYNVWQAHPPARWYRTAEANPPRGVIFRSAAAAERAEKIRQLFLGMKGGATTAEIAALARQQGLLAGVRSPDSAANIIRSALASVARPIR